MSINDVEEKKKELNDKIENKIKEENTKTTKEEKDENITETELNQRKKKEDFLKKKQNL